MKNKDIIIGLILIFTFSLNVKAQDSLPSIQDAKNQIIGEWLRKDNSSAKLIFTANMEQKYYINGTLIWTHQYDIDSVCNNNKLTIDNRFMLKTIKATGEVTSCDIIQSLNSSVLSITTEHQGKTILYKKQ